MHLFILSQDNIELAQHEAVSLLKLKSYRIENQVLLSSGDNDNIKKIPRLAYTKKAFEVLFISNIKNLNNALLDFDFSKIYKQNFCLRIHNINSEYILNESEYAIPIWRSLAKYRIKPVVDLKNPKTTIEIFLIKNNAIVCKLSWINSQDFESRKAHLKQIIIPTAMMPKMARALVNIHGADEIVDPFCGTGGILVEAGLMGIKFKGYDIDRKILLLAEKNLINEKISKNKYILKIQDATNLKKLENVVTDLPYGKSSKKTDEIIDLYSKFIKNIIGRSVIVFPNFVDYKKILKNNLNKKLKIEKILKNYVHKSLTRVVVVIDEKKGSI